MESRSIYSISYNVISAKINEGIGSKFTLKKVSEEIIQKGGILRVDIGITIKDHLECLCAIGFFEKINEEEITYKVVATNLEDAGKIEKNRPYHYYPTPKHDDILF
ncbi:MAG: hypothetical protein WCI91_02660 [Candidatus Nomurabacteria bacterium]